MPSYLGVCEGRLFQLISWFIATDQETRQGTLDGQPRQATAKAALKRLMGYGCVVLYPQCKHACGRESEQFHAHPGRFDVVEEHADFWVPEGKEFEGMSPCRAVVALSGFVDVQLPADDEDGDEDEITRYRLALGRNLVPSVPENVNAEGHPVHDVWSTLHCGWRHAKCVGVAAFEFACRDMSSNSLQFEFDVAVRIFGIGGSLFACTCLEAEHLDRSCRWLQGQKMRTQG